MRTDSTRRARRLSGWLLLLAVACVLMAARPTVAQSGAAFGSAQSRFFITSDGVRLHYIEAGAPGARTIVLVPGWTMPAWIWGPQLKAFSRSYHVIAFDPRGQGDSEVAMSGYEPGRRGQDIAELIATLGGRPVLLAGWSLGVLDVLAYVHSHGDAAFDGLVLVDNSVGEEPAPVPTRGPRRKGPKPDREAYMRQFVRSMFRKPQSEAYLDLLTDATLRVPPTASAALLAYPVPRSYWREAVYSTRKPVLYAVRPGFAAQAANLQHFRPGTETAVFPDAGHALFVDDASEFNALMQDFIQRRVWR